MDPFWLTFGSSETERQYDAYRIDHVLRRGDNIFLWVCLAVEGAALVRSILSDKLWVQGLWVLRVLYTVWEMRKRRIMTAEQELEQRTALVCAKRVVQITFTIVFFPLEEGFEVRNFLALAFKTGLIMVFVQATNSWLKFYYHIPFQLFATVAMLLFAAKGPCTAVMNSPLGSTMVEFANKAGHFSDLASCLTTTVSKLEDLPNPCPCLQVIVWLHVFGILILVSFVLWMQERASRVAFIRTLCEERQKQENLDKVTDFSEFRFQIYVLVFTGMVSVAWRVNKLIVRGLDNLIDVVGGGVHELS